VTAIVPLNVVAVRVSAYDQSNVTPRFKGRTVAFDNLPYQPSAHDASTGDTIARPLALNSASDRLGAGIHLHWDLPDFFRRGVQAPGGGPVRFPPVPNRWLVTRWLGIPGQTGLRWKSWVVESDYISASAPPDPDGKVQRPAVAVPLGSGADGAAPYSFMGRVLDADGWQEQPADYLPNYQGPRGEALHLTSIGFVGPAFSAYYPDCCSVFGFWDSFGDAGAADIFAAINNAASLRFTVGYQVIGWLSDPATDPLTGFADRVRADFDRQVKQSTAENVRVKVDPADVFVTLAEQTMGWVFRKAALSFALHADGTLDTLTAPASTLVAGLAQEIVWDQLHPERDLPFLAADGGAAAWTDAVELTIGNTTPETVSTLVKSHLAPPGGSGVLGNYEFLLDALQIGALRDLEPRGNQLLTLAETLHGSAFSRRFGGLRWTIAPRPDPTKIDSPPAEPVEVMLPLTLAEQLHLLNVAQQAYDAGRARLAEQRRQLFMDWVVYVKQAVALAADPSLPAPVVDTNALSAFLATSGGGELGAVTATGAAVGLVQYALDPVTNHVVAMTTTDIGDTAATRLVAAFGVVKRALDGIKTADPWILEATAAPPFWLPGDPVLLMSGKRIEPARRNGPDRAIAVRTAAELIDTLVVTTPHGPSFRIGAGQVTGMPSVPAGLRDGAAATALAGEAALLMPLAAPLLGQVLAAMPGPGNPALPDPTGFAAALRLAQGGQSPLDATTQSGLFARVHASDYVPAPNASVAVTTDSLTLTFGFVNATAAYPPNAVGWTVQTALPEFTATRVDPFLPVWLTWSLQLDPLSPGPGADYVPSLVLDKYEFGPDAIDYDYRLLGNAPVAGFTTGKPITYSGEVVLNVAPTKSLTTQIDRYRTDFRDDGSDPELVTARDDFAARRTLSQSLSGFSVEQVLRAPIPQITVANLVQGPLFDPVTAAIAAAAVADARDDWYDSAFNAFAPISTGLLAQFNFGPLRSGFLEITSLHIVDVFGQVMTLQTPLTKSGALTVVPSQDLRPRDGDAANAQKVYLPLRLLAPSRLDFNWLSATHNAAVPGVDTDFVEMNDHPATSPVCGWIVPNHLDVVLMFYTDAGDAIGSFGVENNRLKYRTRPGNIGNPTSNLDQDLQPPVNPHLADLMRFIAGRDADFLNDLMATIEHSDGFINPATMAQDVALSVLVGRPLAITRTRIALATLGSVLPLSQANVEGASALRQAVANNWTDYAERQAHTSAAMGDVQFCVRLGNLPNIDDGLVAYLPESDGNARYTTVYSPAAPGGGQHHVVQPPVNTLSVTPNGAALFVTLIVDPRAPVHATTGILPVVEQQIPSDQYADALRKIAVSFTTHPVLRPSGGLSLPLPIEAGFGWSWVATRAAPIPLPARAGSDHATYGFSPQRLLEGWLLLTPQTDSDKQQ